MQLKLVVYITHKTPFTVSYFRYFNIECFMQLFCASFIECSENNSYNFKHTMQMQSQMYIITTQKISAVASYSKTSRITSNKT